MQHISIDDVSKGYHIPGNPESLSVIDRLSLKIERGEFLGIVGPNGCGKTTLLKMLMGIEKPDDGNITVFGGKPESVVSGFVAQHSSTSLFPWLSSVDNVVFAMPKGGNSAAARQQLARFGMDGHAQTYPYQLSGGMKQLVSIARATIASDLLILDEPMSSLDLKNKLLVENTILSLRDGKNTAIIALHDLDSAVLLCDRIAVMTDKPSRIKAVIHTPTGRRSVSSRNDVRFTETIAELRRLVM